MSISDADDSIELLSSPGRLSVREWSGRGSSPEAGGRERLEFVVCWNEQVKGSELRIKRVPCYHVSSLYGQDRFPITCNLIDVTNHTSDRFKGAESFDKENFNLTNNHTQL